MLPCPNTSRQTHNLVVTQPARRCRFASTLSCSPHTRAGLHSQVVCSPHACAGLHSCTHVVVQPTHTRGFAQPCRVQSARMRGFALASSCSLYSSAGLQSSCHAAHTRKRGFASTLPCSSHTAVTPSLQPTRKCRFAASARCHAACTQVQVCITLPSGCSPGSAPRLAMPRL